MTYREILETALRQSAVDLSCRPEDLLSDGRTAVLSRPSPGARRYLTLPFDLNLVWYGRGLVASASRELLPAAREYMDMGEPYALFETPQIGRLNALLAPLGRSACFMAEYFLPDPDRIPDLSCSLELRLLGPSDFTPLYLPQWSNALCEKRKELDVLGVGAFTPQGEMAGFAACSADCETMWQIGVDVLPAYRRQGIASALTSRLAREILERDKVPFYCAAWSNIPSVRNAIRSGFRPAWCELTAKPVSFCDDLIKN